MIEYQLKAAFDPYYEAPVQAWKYFADLGEVLNFKKNQKIKEAGGVDKYGYFLLEGSSGLFAWKENNYICIDLYLENSFFADDISLTTGKPSPIEIVALETSRIFRMSKANIEKLKSIPLGSKLFLIGDQHAYAEKQKQQIELMTKSAEERYAYLINSQPALIQRIHQKYIASYLGITTQSLSRIKKNMIAR